MIEVIATRDIQPDEEIFIDYGKSGLFISPMPRLQNLSHVMISLSHSLSLHTQAKPGKKRGKRTSTTGRVHVDRRRNRLASNRQNGCSP